MAAVVFQAILQDIAMVDQIIRTLNGRLERHEQSLASDVGAAAELSQAISAGCLLATHLGKAGGELTNDKSLGITSRPASMSIQIGAITISWNL